MRPIKFRAYVRRKMEYFDLFDIDGSAPDQFDFGNKPAMQFTGLKDKNGTEIYEGDIVDATKPGYPKWVGHIIFDSTFAGFQVLDEEDDRFDIDDVVVIGNIYENPELLK